MNDKLCVQTANHWGGSIIIMVEPSELEPRSNQIREVSQPCTHHVLPRSIYMGPFFWYVWYIHTAAVQTDKLQLGFPLVQTL